jgi:hypothetical protein
LRKCAPEFFFFLFKKKKKKKKQKRRRNSLRRGWPFDVGEWQVHFVEKGGFN